MTDATDGAGRRAPAEPRRFRVSIFRAILPIALVVLLLGFAAIDSRVLSPGNLVNILQQTSYLAIFAMAQTVVILTRGFDLALGPTVSMVSVGAALAMAKFGGERRPPVLV